MGQVIDLVKYRKGKISSRRHDGRIWLKDAELEKTCFQVGAPYCYSIDKNEVVITAGGPRKVARYKKHDDCYGPIIDIKNLRVKRALNGCDYITIAIYKDRIVVRGHKRTNTAKLDEYRADRSPFRLTSFSFFTTDAPAIEAGFESNGCLMNEDGDGVIYSVPLSEFEASVIPKSYAWFANLEGQEDVSLLNVLHFIRLISQVEPEKKPYLISFSGSGRWLDTAKLFLESIGYNVVFRGSDFTLFSVLEPGEEYPCGDMYGTAYNHLKKGLENIEKRIPFTVVSFYSGCLSDLAYIEEGFDVIRAYDLSKELAAELNLLEDFSNPIPNYVHNIGDHIVAADIPKLKPEDIPDADIHMYSPPCQGLSGENCRTRGLFNSKNRHIRACVDIIKAKLPPVFIIEQVPELLTIGDGFFLREIERELGDTYYITSTVIDAVETGSPQYRKRAILIGSRLGPVALPEIKADSYKTVGEALAGITEEDFNQQDISANRPETIERMKYVRPGSNWHDIPEHLRLKSMSKGNTHSNLYKRLHPDVPSCTLPNFRKCLLIHPFLDRGLSLREAARLMDLPDEYLFVGTISENQQAIGNGIPVNLIRTVARIVRNHVHENLDKSLNDNIRSKQGAKSLYCEENGQLAMFGRAV